MEHATMQPQLVTETIHYFIGTRWYLEIAKSAKPRHLFMYRRIGRAARWVATGIGPIVIVIGLRG